MRIPEKSAANYRPLKVVVLAALVLTLVGFAWVQVRAYSANTFAKRSDLIVAEVLRGDLIREVRAPGTLVPIDLNFVVATSSGRVKEIYLEAGDAVTQNTVVMSLDNPELAQALDSARFTLDVLKAEYSALAQRLDQERLNQRIRVADFSTRYKMAQLRSEANATLLETGAVSSIDYNEAILLAEQLKIQYELEIERLHGLPALHGAQLAAAQAKINQSARLVALQQELVDDLEVKAGSTGVLQEVLMEEGQQFVVGTVLARVANQENLKAQLRVQESQVRDVAVAQPVVVTANGKSATGMVKRIDPAVQQGVVLVDVYFAGDMLEGARPDLRVDGTIQLEKLNHALTLKRPVFSQEHSTSSLFVLNPDDASAERKEIRLGRASVDKIEVLSTLKEGDRVVVSDTSRFNEAALIKLR